MPPKGAKRPQPVSEDEERAYGAVAGHSDQYVRRLFASAVFKPGTHPGGAYIYAPKFVPYAEAVARRLTDEEP